MSVKKNIGRIIISLTLLITLILSTACSGKTDTTTDASETETSTAQNTTADTTMLDETDAVSSEIPDNYLRVFLKNRDYYAIAESGLKLRKDKGSDSEALETIPLAEKLNITDVAAASDGMLWGETKYKGKTGWVCMKYVTDKTTKIYVGKKMSAAIDDLGDYVTSDYFSGGRCYAWFAGQFWLHTADSQIEKVQVGDLPVLKQELIGDYVVPGNLRSNMSYNELCASVAEKPSVEFVEGDFGCYMSTITQGYYEYEFSWEPDESGSLQKDADASSLTIELKGTQAPDEYIIDMSDEQNCTALFDIQTVENRDKDENGDIRYTTTYQKPVVLAGVCAEKINSYYDKAVENFIGPEDDRRQTAASAASMNAEFTHDSLTYILTNNEKLISVVHDDCLDAGGTSPYSYATECFDAKTGELMTLPQVLGKSASETRAIIVASILSYMQYSDTLSESADEKVITETVGRLDLSKLSFYVGSNGYTVLCFNPYMIADGATGRLLIPVVTQ